MKVLIKKAFAIMFFVTLTSCSNGSIDFLIPEKTATPSPTRTVTLSPTPEPTITSTSSPIIAGPTNFPVDVNPLTGQKVADPDILDRLPVAVKVANFPRSFRPQSGLSFADIVFEYTIGWGENRFLAFYYGQDASKVGPMRSARLIDARLVPMYHGVLAYTGADTGVIGRLLSVLGGKLFIDGPNSAPAIWREGWDSEAGVNFVYTNTQEISKLVTLRGIKNQKPNLDGISFNSSEPAVGEPAKKLTVIFGRVYDNGTNQGEWRYDPLTGKYLRWIDYLDENKKTTIIPLIDKLTGEQLAFDNVIVIFASHPNLSQKEHEDIEILVSGDNAHGAAYLFRDGKMIQGTWRSFSLYETLQFLMPDGTPMSLKPGNTWIVIAAKNLSTFEQGEIGEWTLYFNGK
jgi:hypothetical protein